MKQSIRNGTKCVFHTRGSESEWEEYYPKIVRYNNQVCTVMQLGTYSELGSKDYEYYDIQFKNKAEFYAVSGYHLTPCAVKGG